MSGANSDVLRDHLDLAVRVWIDELRDVSPDGRAARADHCASIVAHKGDLLMFKSKKPGESAFVFNRLAEGIACAAFMPGGIRAFGLIFCAQHPKPLGTMSTGSQVCPDCLEEAS